MYDISVVTMPLQGLNHCSAKIKIDKICSDPSCLKFIVKYYVQFLGKLYTNSCIVTF